MLLKGNLLAGAALTLMLAIVGGINISRSQEPLRPAPNIAARPNFIGQEAGSPAASPHGTAYGRWGFDESGVDPQSHPGDSFFDFANGAWDARTAIPADKSRFGMFDALSDKTQQHCLLYTSDAADE